MNNLVPTISVIVTILLVGIALAGVMHNGQMRLESRLTAVEGRLESRLTAVEGRLESRLLAVEKETARLGGLLEGLGLVGRTKPPEGA